MQSRSDMQRTTWALWGLVAIFSVGCAGETTRDDCAAEAGCAEPVPNPPDPPLPTPTPTPTPTPEPEPEPTSEPSCPGTIPSAGAACDGPIACDYVHYSESCGFGQVQASCSAGTWSFAATGACAPAPACDPFGSWQIDFGPQGYEWCGFSGPPSSVEVSLDASGTVLADWDIQVSSDGCTLELEHSYEYNSYETGSETHSLSLTLSGDTATGTYSFWGSGFSGGSCSANVSAKRVK